MSKVQFIQWGTDVTPKKFTDRWSVDKQGKPTGPSTSFSELLSAYAGGVIFVTYKDAKNKDLVQEIWANGVQYSVGAGGAGNIIYGSVPPNSTGIVTIDGETVTGDEGYIYIYKTVDSQTAYYWLGTKWVPFEVDAENVWFHEDITMAGEYVQVGNLTKGTTAGRASVVNQLGLGSGVTDFTLKTLMEKILCKSIQSGAEWQTPELDPNTPAKGSVSVKKGTNSLKHNTSVEVGTVVTASANVTSSSVQQKVSIDTPFGYDIITGKDSDGNNEYTSSSDTSYTQTKSPTKTGTDTVTLTVTTATQVTNTTNQYTIQPGNNQFTPNVTSAKYKGVAFDACTIYPLNNLGEREQGKELGHDKKYAYMTKQADGTYLGNDLTPTAESTSCTIKGYWPYFYGSDAACPTEWKQADLGPTKSEAFTEKQYDIPAGAKVAFVAIPEANSSKTVSITNASTTASFSTAVNKQGVTVTLGGTSQAYTVFYLTAAATTSNTSTFKIKIS